MPVALKEILLTVGAFQTDTTRATGMILIVIIAFIYKVFMLCQALCLAPYPHYLSQSSLQLHYYHPDFIDKETEAQRSKQ